MLITTCTHCLARFRVTPQQLNEKQGQVRCGRCHRVFSGFEALERIPDDDTATRMLAARPTTDDSPPTLGPTEEPAIEPVEPSSDAMTEPLEPEPLPEPEPFTPREPEPEAPAPILPPTPPAAVSPSPSPPMVEPPAPTPSRPLPPRPRPGTKLSLEPPPRPRQRLSRAWALGCFVLFVALALELVYGFRAPLAQRYPVTRPWLQAACARAGCTVPFPRDDSLLRLEDSELLEVPGRPNEIAVGARIRNLAAFAQEYPFIELTLTDNTGQAASRRVLRPTDYLGRPVAPGEALDPGADLAIQLRIETPQLHATGYELLLFYP